MTFGGLQRVRARLRRRFTVEVASPDGHVSSTSRHRTEKRALEHVTGLYRTFTRPGRPRGDVIFVLREDGIEQARWLIPEAPQIATVVVDRRGRILRTL